VTRAQAADAGRIREAAAMVSCTGDHQLNSDSSWSGTAAARSQRPLVTSSRPFGPNAAIACGAVTDRAGPAVGATPVRSRCASRPLQFAPARAGYPADYDGSMDQAYDLRKLLQQHNRGALCLARAAQCTALSGFGLPVGDGGVYLGVAGG
jgi:hypothetical protein